MVVTVACVCAGAPADAQQTAPKTPLAAKLKLCTTGGGLADRSAVFTGSMPTRGGAVRMAMRFELQSRPLSGGFFMPVPLAGFDDWETSAANVGGFVFDKRVQQLDAGVAYRVAVQFRWLDADGKVLRKTDRTSRACKQPDLRPNLRVIGLAVSPAGAAMDRYRVTVRNVGAGTSPDGAGVELQIGGQTTLRGSLTALGPQVAEDVTWTAARCSPGLQLDAIADPDDLVDESDETDNTLQRACPDSATRSMVIADPLLSWTQS